VLTRLAARKTRKNGTKVLYTVHGFHFFKGARLINWLLYYPVEYLLSSFTDVIITMNKEDFNYVNGKMYHKESFLVPGVGVDSKVFYPFNENKILEERKKLGLNPDHFILLYVAEFIHRKNHKMIIDSIPVLKTRIPDIKILFAGKGLLLEKMKISVAEKGIDEHIIFLGFRNDINILSAISDVGISASRQEGLPVGLLQEMFCAKPVVAPYERGHNELIINKVNGFLFNQEDNQGFTECIFKLYSDKSLRAQMGMKSLERAQLFSVVNSLETMASIYRRYLQIRLI
jgi:glycosyltransferase EpsD